MGVVLEVEALKRPVGFPCQLQHLWPIHVEGSRISRHRREIPAPQDAPQRCTGVKSGDDLVPEPKNPHFSPGIFYDQMQVAEVSLMRVPSDEVYQSIVICPIHS